jgi:type II secretion system protein N
VKLLGLEIRTREGKEIYFKETKISPSILSPLYLLFGKFKCSLKLKTEESALTINFTAKNIFRSEKMSLSSVYLTGNINSGDLMRFFDLDGKGNLKIELKLNGDIKNPNSLEGKFLLTSADKDKTIIVLKNTNKLHVPVEGEFSLGKVNAEMTIKNGVMTLDKFEMKGGNIEGNGKGSLIIKNPFFESQIDLTLEIKTNLLNIPSQTIRLRGTLSSPKIG